MAESPSELQAEVEKLERKHAENPEGRYFVPLANDYRKMGELERAEALLRAGLRKHPDYLSAHIVLGRCLADRGATSEAADEFTYVLSMDPQNLIALRSLGELAATEGRRDDAGRWYRELLAVDPMNEDARRALEQLDAAEEAAPEPESAEAGAWWDADAAEGAEPAAAAIDRDAPGNHREDVDEAAEDDRSRTASFSGAAPDENQYGEFLDIDTAVGSEDMHPAGGQQPEYGMMELSASEDDTGYEGGYEDSGADEIEPVEVVTETIAELYARQGLHERAADVYRELIRRRGGDAALERRLEELERTAAGSERAADDPFAASFAEGFGDDTPSAPDEPWTAAADETAEQGAGAGAWGADLEAPTGEEAGRQAWSATGEEPEEQPSSGDRGSTLPAESWAAAAEEPAEQETPDQEAPGYEAPDDEIPGYEALADEPQGDREAAPAPARIGARTAGRTIGGYLSSLAAWTPAAEPEPEAVELGVDEVAETEASGAETSTGGGEPVDTFPWEVPGDEATPAASGGAPEEEPARGTSADPESVAAPEPTAGADWGASPEQEPAGEELPGPSDLEPEPSIELEDYFPADDADAGAEPAEAPPPAPSGGASAAQEDDDLESFQAWLRSLKR